MFLTIFRSNNGTGLVAYDSHFEYSSLFIFKWLSIAIEFAIQNLESYLELEIFRGIYWWYTTATMNIWWGGLLYFLKFWPFRDRKANCVLEVYFVLYLWLFHESITLSRSFWMRRMKQNLKHSTCILHYLSCLLKVVITS